MSTSAGEFVEGTSCCREGSDVVRAENGPQNNGDHNGSRNITSSASSASAFDQPRCGSTSCNQDTVQNASSNCDVMVRRRSVKMTSSSTQLNDVRDENKIQTQINSEKEPLNSPKPSKSRKDQFCKVFPDIAETDEVIKSYHCAFFRDILLQGFLFITPNWFCFYSKLLGKKSIKIPVSVVTNITKKKTAIIIPNAIRVNTETDKYVFGSLMSRDNAYQLMFNVWQEKRKVLQTNIPLEQEKSDVNEDLETVASASVNSESSSLMTSAKDEFVVSSDASFCSDLETTSQSVELQQPERPRSASVLAAERGTAVDFAGEGSKESSVFRFPSQSAAASGANADKPNQNVQLKTPFTSVNGLVTWILNLPRTCLFLTISTVLVLFLLLSAMLLAYKLINLQMQLATYVGWSYNDDITVESGPNREVLQDAYVTRHDFHISNVEKIHMILESHVEVLSKVNQVLKELQRLAVNTCASVSSAVENS